MRHIVIGITGGIGSGKSTVLNILKNKYNSYILEADKIGHIVMEPGEKAYDKIIDFFGTEILGDDLYEMSDDTAKNLSTDNKKFIDRKKLGAIVFKDKDKLEILNSIVHPCVKEYIQERISEIQSTNDRSIIFIEAALLIEDHYEAICDYLWYIYADKEVRFNRVSTSRDMTRERFEEIVSNQLPDKVFREKCHLIINNSNTIEDTEKQISIELNKLTKED